MEIEELYFKEITLYVGVYPKNSGDTIQCAGLGWFEELKQSTYP